MELDEKDQALWNRYDRPTLTTRFEHLEDPYYKGLVSDDNLPRIIELHNAELKKLIDTKERDVKRIKELCYRNMNFYRLANFRGIRVFDKNFMLAIATEIGEDLNSAYNDLYDEELSDRRSFCQTSGHSHSSKK